MLALAVGGVELRSWWRDRPPVAAVDVRASGQVEVVRPEAAQQRLDELAGVGRLSALSPGGSGTDQELVGQVTVASPPVADKDTELALFVIDRRRGTVLSVLNGVGPERSNLGPGWDGRYDLVAANYPWLRALASVPEPGGSGWTDPGMALSMHASLPASVTFVGLPSPDALPITDPASQLTVALALVGNRDDGPVYWAKRVDLR